MVSINNLSVEFSAKALFDNVTYVINRRDKIALVGKNGAGKSTMLKIIAGLQRPTSGSVSVARDMTIGYLPQQMVLADDTTCIEEASKAFAHIDRMQQRLDELNAELAERTDYDSQSYQDLIDAMTSLTERLAMEQSDNKRAETEKTLLGLGFTRGDFDRPTSEFSGGWRMRIELAKILLSRPDILLLDEPTNHLDIESIQWLEQFLMTKAKSVVLVSHDRAFIDNVTNRTIEISLGKIYDYAVNYSKYLVLRAERLEQQRRAFANQQKQIQETEDFIERFRYKATKSADPVQLVDDYPPHLPFTDLVKQSLELGPVGVLPRIAFILENLAAAAFQLVLAEVNLALNTDTVLAVNGLSGINIIFSNVHCRLLSYGNGATNLTSILYH